MAIPPNFNYHRPDRTPFPRHREQESAISKTRSIFGRAIEELRAGKSSARPKETKVNENFKSAVMEAIITPRNALDFSTLFTTKRKPLPVYGWEIDFLLNSWKVKDSEFTNFMKAALGLNVFDEITPFELAKLALKKFGVLKLAELTKFGIVDEPERIQLVEIIIEKSLPMFGLVEFATSDPKKISELYCRALFYRLLSFANPYSDESINSIQSLLSRPIIKQITSSKNSVREIFQQLTNNSQDPKILNLLTLFEQRRDALAEEELEQLFQRDLFYQPSPEDIKLSLELLGRMPLRVLKCLMANEVDLKQKAKSLSIPQDILKESIQNEMTLRSKELETLFQDFDHFTLIDDQKFTEKLLIRHELSFGDLSERLDLEIQRRFNLPIDPIPLEHLNHNQLMILFCANGVKQELLAKIYSVTPDDLRIIINNEMNRRISELKELVTNLPTEQLFITDQHISYFGVQAHSFFINELDRRNENLMSLS